VKFNNFLHQGKTNSRAVSAWAEFVEKTKDTVMVLGRDTDAIIPDEEGRVSVCQVFALLPDLDTWAGLISHVFGSIVDEILQDLCQTPAVASNGGQTWLDLDRDLPRI
jgi:hypothetical protein